VRFSCVNHRNRGSDEERSQTVGAWVLWDYGWKLNAKRGMMNWTELKNGVREKRPAAVGSAAVCVSVYNRKGEMFDVQF